LIACKYVGHLAWVQVYWKNIIKSFQTRQIICQMDHRREETRQIVNMGEEEDMMCSKTTSPLRDARGNSIEADH